MTTRYNNFINPTKKTKTYKFACALLFAEYVDCKPESWGVILGCLKEVVNSRFEYKFGGEAFKIKAANNLLQFDSLGDSLFPWKTSSTTKFSRSPMALVKQLNLSWAKNHCHHNRQLWLLWFFFGRLFLKHLALCKETFANSAYVMYNTWKNRYLGTFLNILCKIVVFLCDPNRNISKQSSCFWIPPFQLFHIGGKPGHLVDSEL